MIIKLEIKSDSEKAWQLPNGAWIPKSVLDSRGLDHPYYEIKDWWITKQVEAIHVHGSNVDVRIIETFKALQLMVIPRRDLPTSIREKAAKYWGGLASDLGSHTPEREPRLWGNDCFDGDPINYGG